jgi:GTP-binding protein YchF
LAAPYAFATVDPNVGVAKVPDDRLQRLAIMSQTKTIVPASVQFVDIAGLVEGAAQGEGLGNRFLAHIREVDAIVFILRAFIDTDVDGSSDPVDQLNTLEVELVYSDLETLEKQADKRRKAARADKTLADEVAAMDAALELLQAGTPIYRSQLDEAQRHLLKPFFLLTAKPAMALVNLDEEQLVDPEPLLAPVREAFGSGAGDQVIGLCIQLEAEAAMLDEESRAEMLEALGLGEGALPAFLHAAYQMLGLRTFFTTGEKETRAWTFRTGSKAPQCAGVIHTDFERGFIRAETIHWDELLELGSWAKAREVGKARIEGKEYVVADGDVMDFRFNV